MAQPTGISLDENLDFVVNEVGDIETDTGVAEPRKNLGYLCYRILSNVEGKHPDRELLTDIEIAIRQTLSQYERVESVESVEAYEPETDDARITVDVTVIADSTELTVTRSA